MSTPNRCHCRSCTIKSLMGPAVVITIGILFLLHQTHSGRFFFPNTWPMLLVVIGAIQVATALAPRDGHIEPPVPGTIPPPAMPSTPPVVPPQTPYSAQGQ
jgi:hypothetical protein